MNTPDETRHSAVTPGGRYRYQLVVDDDGDELTNMLMAWKLDKDGTWLVEMIVHVADDGLGPATVGTPEGPPLNRGDDAFNEALTEAYMRAAGHLWAARTGGLWDT